jgi:hypothetical protein
MGIGILSTVPIIFYVGFKSSAATIPIQVVLFSIAIYTLIRWIKPKYEVIVPPHTDSSYGLMIFSVMILVLIIAGPLIIRVSAKPYPIENMPACSGETRPAYIRWNEGSAVQIMPDDQLPYSSLPYVRSTDFRKGDLYHFDIKFNQAMKQLSDYQILMNAYEFGSRKAVWVIMNRDLMPKANGVIALCGRYIPATASNKVIFYASYAQAIQ